MHKSPISDLCINGNTLWSCGGSDVCVWNIKVNILQISQ